MKFIDKYVKKFIQKDKNYNLFESEIFKISKLLINKTCTGNNMLGWQDLNININLNQIKNIAENINSKSDCVLIIGIGGSYLGAKMAINFLNPVNKNKIYFIGHNLDSEYLNNILEKIKDKKIHVLVISKSGNTIEIKATLNIIINFINKKYNKNININKYFTAITGKNGFLRNFAESNNWQILDIPENIGGRFSVLTNVGLLPIAISGADIEKIILGAKEIKKNLENLNNNYNYYYKYAIIRNILYKNNFKIELFSSFNTRMIFFIEWLKQLFGESEGKENKGIFPASAFFSTDLHSLGQFIQEGSKILFETVFFVKNLKLDLKLSKNYNNYNYKSFNEINKKIFESTILAHYNGQVPCNIIEIEDFSEFELGKLIYFFEFSCALSALALGVNPFNQPGVEIYKKIMLN